MSARKIRLHTPAKVNFLLWVLNKRDDGYHDILSVIVPVSLWDVVEIEPTSGKISLEVVMGRIPDALAHSGEVSSLAAGMEPAAWARPERNLATQAALILKEASGYSGGARVHIEKNIPVQAGLGGGSADAAAVLTGLNALWATGMTRSELAALGARAGSDVPALTYGGPVLAEAAGERVAPLSMNMRDKAGGWWLVIANPGFGTSTRDIYSRCSSPLTRKNAEAKEMIRALEEGDLDAAVGCAANDLQETVFRKYPLIRLIAGELSEGGALNSLLCGSGSSLLAFARGEEHARDIETRVCRSLGPWLWTRVVKVVPDGVMVAHGPLEARV